MSRQIDENFSLHAQKIPSQTHGMQVITLDHLTYVDSGLPCDTFNIIHISNGQDLLSEELNEALNHFRKRNLAYCIWINEENLTNTVQGYFDHHQLSKQGGEIGMVLDLTSYDPIHHPEYSNIRSVDNKNLLEAYGEIIAQNWTPMDKNILRYYELTSETYLEKNTGIIFLLYFHLSKPVACLELFPTDEVTIGIYGFATIEAYRGKGIGSALFTYALNKCKKMGYHQVVLQASEDGIGIYRKLGFQDVIAYFEFSE